MVTSGRFEVVVEDGIPRGDLFLLEVTIHHRVMDRKSGRVVLAFEGLLEARMSREDGSWEDWRLSGVREVCIAPDEQSVLVRYSDGREETLALPAETDIEPTEESGGALCHF